MSSVVVVGAGVFGAALADRLVTRGHDVTLVDRFGPGDARSESGGETRLLRFSHGADAFYCASARRARELWLELGVLVESGVLWLAQREHGWEADSERVLREQGIPVERLEPSAAARLFPSLAVDDLAFALLEPDAGVLRASDGVRALVARAREGGLRLELGAARPDGERVRLGDAVLEADQVVWACGAWLAELFPELVRLRVTSQAVVLFDADRGMGQPRRPGLARLRRQRLRPRRDRAARHEGRLRPRGRAGGAGPAAGRGRSRHGRRGARVPRGAVPVPGRRPGPLGAAPATTRSPPTATSSSPAIPSTSASGCSAAARGTATSTARRLAEHAAAVLAGEAEPKPRFGLAKRAPSGALRTAGS